MKIAVCSDLHLEFGDLDLHNEENADRLILGGDIMVADDLAAFGNTVVPATERVQARAERYNNFILLKLFEAPSVI